MRIPATASLTLLLVLPSVVLAQNGPFLVIDAYPGAAGSGPSSLTDLAGTLLYRADDGTHGAEIWRSDGSAAGTRMVVDFNPGALPSIPAFLTEFDGAVIYRGGDANVSAELMISDGTAAGTRIVRDIEPGSIQSQISGFVRVGDHLYFRGWPQSLGAELWRTDGTTLGTVMVRDINPGQGGSLPFGLNRVSGVAFRDALLFMASDNRDGLELWRSGGTAASTWLVADIQPGSGSSQPRYFAVLDDRVLFTADDGISGRELWVTDGTAAGTQQVVDLNPGSGSGAPTALTVWNGAVYFAGEDGQNGAELWVTDGTAAGTTLVADLQAGVGGASPTSLAVAGDALYFVADGGSTGKELWRTDGTASGTVQVADLQAGAGDGIPSGELFVVGDGGLLAFAGDDGQSGLEPWVSDGTAAGTRRLGDVQPGSGGSSPSGFTASGRHLFFVADDGTHGSELWAVSLVDLGVPLARVYGKGCQGTGGFVPTIAAVGAPTIGSPSFAVETRNVYTVGVNGRRQGALLWSLDRARLDLGAGCRGWIGAPILAMPRFFFGSSTFATLPVAIPNDPALVGGELFCQWAILDPGAPNGAFAASRGLQVLIGR